MLGQRIVTAVGLVAVLALVLVVLPRDLAVLALGAAGPAGRLGMGAARRTSRAWPRARPTSLPAPRRWRASGS